jgi:citrate synthase
MWLHAEEALKRLGSKPQSLYASVSRGRIRARPDPADSRRSLYNAEDVDRLAARARGRRSSASVAAQAISWGEPVLPSAISTIIGGRLIYRGHDAAELAQTATLEDVASLLWGGLFPVLPVTATLPADEPMTAAFTTIAARAAVASPTLARGQLALREEASRVLELMADALLGGGSGPLHLRLAARFERPEAAETLRMALVLLADHELNASTFAARVTVSTGASIAAGVLAGLAALHGPLHGDAATAVLALAEDMAGSGDDAEAALREWLGEGRVVPGFGHTLYPGGDPRCVALLAGLQLPPGFAALAQAGQRVTGDFPNIDFGLAAITAIHTLPREAPITIFALARTVGWLAHLLEQVASGKLIRPRARYVGQSAAHADAHPTQV